MPSGYQLPTAREAHIRDLRSLLSLTSDLSLRQQDEIALIIRRILAYETDAISRGPINLIWAGENVKRIKNQRDTYLNILLQIIAVVKAEGCGTKITTHVLTLKRFLEEQQGGEFTMEQAEAQFKEELALVLSAAHSAQSS